MDPEGFDMNSDGIVDQVAMDTTGDGIADVWGFDQNQDGVVEQLAMDTTGEGVADTWALDENQDGSHEQLAYDTTGDGFADTWVADQSQAGIADANSQNPDLARIIGEATVVGPATYDGPGRLLNELARHSGEAYMGLDDPNEPDRRADKDFDNVPDYYDRNPDRRD